MNPTPQPRGDKRQAGSGTSSEMVQGSWLDVARWPPAVTCSFGHHSGLFSCHTSASSMPGVTPKRTACARFWGSGAPARCRGQPPPAGLSSAPRCVRLKLPLAVGSPKQKRDLGLKIDAAAPCRPPGLGTGHSGREDGPRQLHGTSAVTPAGQN